MYFYVYTVVILAILFIFFLADLALLAILCWSGFACIYYLTSWDTLDIQGTS